MESRLLSSARRAAFWDLVEIFLTQPAEAGTPYL